ncbi:hypothetical protein Goarm_022239 [Gossypium armourianum]|uniref:Reverse transcriptase n=1 Tax=Gossypium armourianum TaxID=34283 RepID=A0A7J9KFI3_9ROSI|nr:hypothetical protein [Gossypium armourianum]
MSAFWEVLRECYLSDLGFSGQWFTWEIGSLPSNNIRERLNRGVANIEWWDLFLEYSIEHMSHSFSDHCPVMLITTGKVEG